MRWLSYFTSERVTFSRIQKEHIVFFLVLPASIGLLLGAVQANYGMEFSRSVTLTLWPFALLSLWLTAGIGTWVLLSLSKKWLSWPFWTVLIAGAVFGKFLTWPARAVLVNSVLGWFGEDALDGALINNLGPLNGSLPFFLDVFLLPVSLWVGANYAFAYFMGFRLFGHPITQSRPSLDPLTQSPPIPTVQQPEVTKNTENETFDSLPTPRILSEIADYSGEPILCLASDGNYTRVYAAKKSWLVRYTFQKSLHDFKPLNAGHQVHRCYWVCSSAVQYVKRKGRVYELCLTNGLKIPVSRSYCEIARQLQAQVLARGVNSTQNMPASH